MDGYVEDSGSAQVDSSVSAKTITDPNGVSIGTISAQSSIKGTKNGKTIIDDSDSANGNFDFNGDGAGEADVNET